MTKVSYDGPRYRVQLQVFDYSDAGIEKWRNDPVKFAVDRLDRRCPKATAFSTGDQMYYGEDVKQAIQCVRAIIQREPEIPRWLKRYVKREAPGGTETE